MSSQALATLSYELNRYCQFTRNSSTYYEIYKEHLCIAGTVHKKIAVSDRLSNTVQFHQSNSFDIEISVFPKNMQNKIFNKELLFLYDILVLYSNGVGRLGRERSPTAPRNTGKFPRKFPKY